MIAARSNKTQIKYVLAPRITMLELVLGLRVFIIRKATKPKIITIAVETRPIAGSEEDIKLLLI